MASLWGRLEARIVVPTGGWTDAGNFTLTESAAGGAQDVTITAGNYWWNTADATNTFLAQLKADLEAASFNTLTYTVTLSDGESGTGQLTLAVSSGTSTLAWGSGNGAIVQALVGSTNASEAFTSSGLTLDNHVQAAWLPECPYNADNAPINANTFAGAGNVVAQAAVSMAANGTYRCFIGDTHRRNRIMWDLVQGGKTWAKLSSGSGTQLTNSAFDDFWDDAVYGTASWAANPGYLIRFYPDCTSSVSSTFSVMNPSPIPATMADPTYTGWWRVEMDVSAT